MARFADRIWELRWIPPQQLCYAPRFRCEASGGWSCARMRAVMEALRREVAKAPVYACDDVADYFFATAARDRGLRAEDFPAVVIPTHGAFIEFRGRRPQEEAKGRAIGAHLPHWWGWHVTRHAPAEFAEALGRDNVPVGCSHGLLCTLWMAPEDHDFFAPLATFGLHVASDGEIVGPPLRAFAFSHDPERLLDAHGQMGYFGVLFLPLVAALCFMACTETRIAVMTPEGKLNKVRIGRKKRPFVPYHVPDCAAIRDMLRYDGMAGIAGLAAALRTCRHHFVRRLVDESAILLPPGSRP